MPIDPASQPTGPASPADSTPASGRRPPWISPLVGVLVVAALGVAGWQGWQYMHPTDAVSKQPPGPTSVPGRPMFTLTGSVSRTGKDGQKQAAKDATVVIRQPVWDPDQQEEWEKRVNDTLAKACKELGGAEAPPTVTADPDSVRRADQAMMKRQAAGKPGTPWNRQCATEFVAFLKGHSVEAGRATAGADGEFSIKSAPPGGVPYIVHASAGGAQWVAKLGRGSNRLDLNDEHLVTE